MGLRLNITEVESNLRSLRRGDKVAVREGSKKKTLEWRQQ
jgi:hypothetical protein